MQRDGQRVLVIGARSCCGCGAGVHGSCLRYFLQCSAGAGPSGLVAAKYLLSSKWGCKVSIYEQGTTIGGTFVNKTYDNTTLVSSKYITLFGMPRVSLGWACVCVSSAELVLTFCAADLRCPPEEAEHMTAAAYVEYLDRYCDTFDLRPHISFGRTVTSVLKVEADGNFKVEHTDASNRTYSEIFDFVIVCSGLHNVPKLPQIEGLDSFSGKVIHSSEYKEPSLFRDKRVLIVGSGETGACPCRRSVHLRKLTIFL